MKCHSLTLRPTLRKWAIVTFTQQNKTIDSKLQQVDDWMLLKITEKINQRNVFEQKKQRPELSADRPSNNCAL